MLCLDNEKQKEKTRSKIIATQNILLINAIACY